MLGRLARAFALAVVVAAPAGCASLVAGLSPAGPSRGTESARRLAPGPWAVAKRDATLVDASRPTPRNGDYPGASSRSLAVTLWTPESAPGPLPLVVYSHGFLSLREEAEPLASHLASHGYAVASLDFPLSGWDAPGGPTLRDLAGQPGDVRFVIDALLAGTPELRLPAPVDPARIAAIGLSLGGLTAELVAFHPTLRDPRVRAAVSIAGPAALFLPQFYATSPVPLLMIAGTADAIVDYPSHAAGLLERAPHAALLSLAGATHVGFSGLSATWLELWPNPDSLGCRELEQRLREQEPGFDPFAALGGPAQGIAQGAWGRPPCSDTLPVDTMRPVRQQRLLRLAVRAFLDAQLAADPGARLDAWRYLSETLPRELPDASFASHGIALP